MAVDSKFFNIPFGTSGDRATIPEASQPSGAVSYTQGFGPDYERDPDTDPAAKRVPRDETNEYIYQITNALKFIQLYGLPQYTAIADGGPANYPISARVRYDAGAGMQAWISLVATNTAVPGADATKWALDEAFSLTALEATQAEANAGLIGTKIITPRRMSSAVQRGAWNYIAAAGSANALTATLSPVPAALVAGLQVNLLLATTNTAAATLNLNGLGAVNILNADGTAISAGQLSPGLVSLIYNGAVWMIDNSVLATESKPGSVELGATAELTAGADLTRVPSIGRIAAQIQSGSWHYGVDTGAANALVVTLVPPLAAYAAGVTIFVNPSNDNTGPSTININGLGVKSIIDTSGSALAAGDIRASNQIICLVYDGVNFQLIGVVTASQTVRGDLRLATQAEANAGTINSAAVTPSTMAQAVQSGRWNYAIAGGTVDAITVALVPAPPAYADGIIVNTQLSGSNTISGVTVNMNGLGAVPLLLSNGGVLNPGDINFGPISLMYRAGSFFIINMFPAKETGRGVVELGSAAEITAGTDLTRVPSISRLSDQIQAGTWNYVLATGTAAAIIATIIPAVAAYTTGMRIGVKLASDIAGATTVNVNGLGAKNIVLPGGGALSYRDYLAGQVVSLVYDGTSFQAETPIDNAIISTALTRTIYGGGDFADINAANLWCSRRRIASSGSVAFTLANGKFTSAGVTQRFSHSDGQRVTFAGGALIAGGFPATGSFTCTGNSSGARASDTTANLVLLRARFVTELAFTGAAGLQWGIVGATSNILGTGDGSAVDGILFVGTPNAAVSNVVGVGFGGRCFVSAQSNLSTTNIGGLGGGSTGASCEAGSSWGVLGAVIGFSCAGSGIVASGASMSAVNVGGWFAAKGNAVKGIFASDNGAIEANANANTIADRNATYGITATRGGIVLAPSSVSSNHTQGYLAENDAWIDASNTTGTGNTNGYGATGKSYIVQTGGTAGALSPASNTIGNDMSYIKS